MAITQKGNLIGLKALGHLTYKEHAGTPSSSPRSLRGQGGDLDVTPSTLFDLASVTKAVATTTTAAILYERGLLELDAPIAGTIPEFLGPQDPRRRDVTFRMLLAHSSGLPAYEKLFLKARTRDELLHAAFTTPLTADPATRAEYSDIGFIILGTALERIAEESLDRFCQREIFGPLSMTNTTFNPPQDLHPQIPPTADDRSFRNKIIQGEVQDENAWVLGGVAGQAGLFSTAEDVARFAQAMLPCGADLPRATAADAHVRELPDEELLSTQAPGADTNVNSLLRPETISFFTRRESAPPGTSRALGWDTPSQPSQSGKYLGPRSFGHLGYTGTSLWIDPDQQLSVTLLTNRTWPDCSNQAIKQVRPKFHDAVLEALQNR